jgi:hypothetical protein
VAMAEAERPSPATGLTPRPAPGFWTTRTSRSRRYGGWLGEPFEPASAEIVTIATT